MAVERLVYLNGVMVPEADARISLFDSQNIWGDMVFETMRTLTTDVQAARASGSPVRLADDDAH